MAGLDRTDRSFKTAERIRRLVLRRGRKLVARLSYDTRAQALPRGVRALNQSERRMLYLAEEYEVVVKVSVDVTTGLQCLSGQVLADGLPATAATVWLAGVTDQPGNVDEDGEFRLSVPSAAVYELGVKDGRDRIRVPAVDLRDGHGAPYPES